MPNEDSVDAATRLLIGTPEFQQLTAAERDHLPTLAAVAELARVVWEDDDAAREFLTNAQPQLDGRSPLELALGGADLRPVEALLVRLEYSLPV